MHDVGINLRCRDVLMAEQDLKRADVIAIFQKMRGKRMAQRVARRPFFNFNFGHRHLHCPLQVVLLQMMPQQGGAIRPTGRI